MNDPKNVTSSDDEEVPENVKKYFDTFTKSIINALREEIRAELPNIKDSVAQNSKDIRFLEEQVSEMKDDIEQNTNSTEDNATDIKENQAQINKINQNLSLQALMIKEVEDSLEKSAQTAEQNSENINILYQGT